MTIQLFHTWELFENGHRWNINTCTQCGAVKKMIGTGRVKRTGYERQRQCYSKDGFKTIDTKAGNCFRLIK
jgi:hypothetical protein